MLLMLLIRIMSLSLTILEDVVEEVEMAVAEEVIEVEAVVDLDQLVSFVINMDMKRFTAGADSIKIL